MSSNTDQPLSVKTLDQIRANDAFERIQKLSNAKAEKKQDADQTANVYATESRKLPVRIIAAGLGQALAFLYAKSASNPPRGSAIEVLLVDLGRWVLNRTNPVTGGATGLVERDSLIKAIVQGDALFLRRATDETLAYLKWLNRFAEAHSLTKEV